MRRSTRLSIGANNAAPVTSNGGPADAADGQGSSTALVDDAPASSARGSRSRSNARSKAAPSAAAAGKGQKRKAGSGVTGGSLKRPMKKVTAPPSDDDDDGDSEEVDAPRRSTQSKKQEAGKSTGKSKGASDATRSRKLKGKSKIKAAARNVVVDSASSSDESSTSMATSSTDEATAKTAKTTQAIEGADGKYTDWREFPSELTFEHLPIELWDLVISVDSSLDIRDHLALAGSGRFLRSCYTDLVWQILFQAETGLTLAPDQISIATKSWGSKVANFASDGRKRTYTFGEGWTTWPLYALGPFARGWAPARGILSAGMTAKRWTESRWGASRDGWEVAESLQRPQQEATKAAVIADPRAERRYDAATGMIEVAPGLFDFAIFDDLSEQEQSVFTNYLNDRRQAQRRARRNKATEWEPFPSVWRSLVVQLVNWPLVPARWASYYFGLTDEERDAISLASLDEDPKKRQRKYRLSALHSAALLLHGGPNGHASFMAKKS